MQVLSDLVCVLTVPPDLPIRKLFSQPGLKPRDIVSIRRLTDHPRQRHSFLIQFVSPGVAQTFLQKTNGMLFNPQRPYETAFVVYLEGVRIVAPGASLVAPVGHFEIPSCPRCLEKLDANATGLINLPG